jgi:hypothetical protein
MVLLEVQVRLEQPEQVELLELPEHPELLVFPVINTQQHQLIR